MPTKTLYNHIKFPSIKVFIPLQYRTKVLLTHSQYSVIRNCGSISLHNPSSLTTCSWLAFANISISLRNSLWWNSSRVRRDFTTTSVSGSASPRIWWALARNTSPYWPLPGGRKQIYYNELFHILDISWTDEWIRFVGFSWHHPAFGVTQFDYWYICNNTTPNCNPFLNEQLVNSG